MHAHRFREQLANNTLAPTSGFIACPAAVLPRNSEVHGAWLELYRRAFEQAQAVNRPSRLERLVASNWN